MLVYGRLPHGPLAVLKNVWISERYFPVLYFRSRLTKKQLCYLLGFFSYFRKHIESFADKARLLTDLTANRVPQNIVPLWTEHHTEALNALKSELARACETSLHTVQLDRPYDVYHMSTQADM